MEAIRKKRDGIKRAGLIAKALWRESVEFPVLPNTVLQ